MKTFYLFFSYIIKKNKKKLVKLIKMKDEIENLRFLAFIIITTHDTFEGLANSSKSLVFPLHIKMSRMDIYVLSAMCIAYSDRL